MSIKASENSAQVVASTLKSGLSEYTSFRLKAVVGQAPPADNSSHDGAVSTAIANSLKGWDSLIDKDAQAVVTMVASLEQTDEQLAAMLGGATK